jgi:hypothetical protein
LWTILESKEVNETEENFVAPKAVLRIVYSHQKSVERNWFETYRLHINEKLMFFLDWLKPFNSIQ